MDNYIVEVIGTARELYCVVADSAEDAMARWFDGDLVLSETTDCEATNVLYD